MRSSPSGALGVLVVCLALLALSRSIVPRPASVPFERHAAPSPIARSLAAGERIDPNAASADELMLLPRIGPRLAQRIVEDRERNGRFIDIEALGRVPGIGARTLDRLRPFLEVARSPVTDASVAPAPRSR